ncbi:MAG: zf-HC2 domain-containing protein [Deltaproteobacteria bacterium]|nr:zf-HC2 domain-containing protein [Deltaproteobacteria bacterium]
MKRPEPEADCGRVAGRLTPYVDGELDIVHAVEVEGHLDRCERCAEKVALVRAVRGSLRRVSGVPAPVALRARIEATMQRERAAGAATGAEREAPGRPRLVRLRYVAPLAAAAVLVLVLGALRMRARAGEPWLGFGARHADSAGWQASSATLDGLLEDLVCQHAQPLPPEYTDPEKLPELDRFVGVRVRPQPLDPLGARYMGARVLSVQDRRAAMLRYVVRNRHQVTMYVFDPQRVPVRSQSTRLVRRHVTPGNVYVFVGRMRGYAVAASERSGVGYALASDLDDDESEKLILAAAR